MKQRLIELLDMDFGYVEEMPAEKLADYLLANGVIVLPLQVGDTVYEVDSARIYESRVKCVIYDTTTVAFDETAIGGSIFLSREDAERALAKRKEGDNAQMD